MLRIKPSKAIEIIRINIKEAGLKMPIDCRTSLELSLDLLNDLSSERRLLGYDNKDLRPHEERESPL